jgi:hypothetical protein
MTKDLKLKTAGVLAGAAAVGSLLYPLVIRPWLLRWGATDDELNWEWPGDELTPHRDGEATRAITIHASAHEVWAWLMQIGQDRGGFYSYTWLENLLGCKMHNADKIIPEFQHRKVGETVWLTPKERYGGRARMVIHELIPNRAMILVPAEDAKTVEKTGRAPGGTWGFVLEPLDEHTTRLIVCSRSSQNQTCLGKLFERTVFDPAHFIMERRMMLGIKERAEKAAAHSDLQAA